MRTSTTFTGLVTISLLVLVCLCDARTGSTAENSLQMQQDAAKSLIESAWEKLGRFNEITSPQALNHNTGGLSTPVPCTCGVFLSGQFDKSSNAQPRGNPALMHEQDVLLACNQQGNKQCTNRCLEMIVKHLPNSPNIICGTIDRDCHRERAYLFIQNCNNTWVNTKLSAGREYCCKAGVSVPCPLSL